MQIVTDSGLDLFLTPEELKDLKIHIVPLIVSLDGKSYRENVDIGRDEFYQLLEKSGNLPTTSMPSSGEFADLYRELGKDDPDILSIHISSGLSGTYNTAKTGAEMVDDVNITVVDSKTLSAAGGWQVEMAARAAKVGKPLDEILQIIQKISDASDSIFTIRELKYLIHGGRISHMKGLVASILNIKPIIGVDKVTGKYEQWGQERSFKKALRKLVDLIAKQHGEGTSLRVQILHSYCPEDGEMLKEMMAKRFDCHFLPTSTISLVLGAHTGKTMVGAAYAAESVFEEMPR